MKKGGINLTHCRACRIEQLEDRNLLAADPIRINVGGGDFVDSNGNLFMADQFSVNGGTFDAPSLNIAGTVDDVLYRTERFGDPLGYEIPVDNGSYTVRLHFAEIFFGLPGQFGSRVFDVSIENELVIDDLNLVDSVGAATALIEEFNSVQVTDGSLSLQLDASVNNGKLSAIEVIPESSTVRINAGGPAHTDSEGNEFLADQFFDPAQFVGLPNGGVFTVGNDIFIVGTGTGTENDEDVDDILYQTTRFGRNFDYEIPIANGFYNLRLHYSENFFDDAGERIFDVEAEGDLISDNLDIFDTRRNAFTPGNFSSLIQEFSLIEVTDGALSLNFESIGIDGESDAKIAAIEVLPVETPQLAVFQTGGGTVVSESGQNDTYTLSLTVAPTDDVTVTIVTGPEVSADETVLTFTPENFDQPQTVVLSAVDDEDEEGTQTVQISHTLASADPVYDGLAAPGLSVTVLDDDLVPVDFNMRTLVGGINDPTTGAFGPDGRLYVATVSGQIRAYTLDGDYNVTNTQIITTIENQNDAGNILGIAFNPFERVAPGESPTIYISRSDLFRQTTQFLSRVSTLTGPNFSTVTDIVTGLPVSGFDHGVNGLQFDQNGDLLIAIGGNTNTGVFDGVFGSDAPESPLTSGVLRARISDPNFNGNIEYEFIDPNDPNIPFPGQPNNQLNGEFLRVRDVPGEVEVETFAVGLRNPYDLVFTTDGRVFATDNGPNGIAEDELNLVPEGAFLGHPSIPRGRLDPRQTLENAEYDPTVPSDEDYTAPLAELPSSTNGIDEYRAETFGGQLRGQLVAQRLGGQVFFFQRTEDGLGIENINTRNDIADGLDLVTGPGGVIFGIDFSGNSNRVTIAEPVDNDVTTPTPYDIFPFRAPAVGGNQFVIGGTNFGTLADTTVTIGGQQATITSVEDRRIVGVFPAVAGSDSFLDVTVTSAGATETLQGAFLPLGEGPAVSQGDYNGDNVVDVADFTVWRDSLNASVTPFTGADGDGDGVISVDDYQVWRDNFGAVVTPADPPSVQTSQVVIGGDGGGSAVAAEEESPAAGAAAIDSGFAILFDEPAPSRDAAGATLLSTQPTASDTGVGDSLLLLAEELNAADAASGSYTADFDSALSDTAGDEDEQADDEFVGVGLSLL